MNFTGKDYFQYSAQPFPHAAIPRLIEPGAYAQLNFPDLPARKDGRIGRDLFPGEEGWAELMETPGWKQLSAQFMSEAFVRASVDLFAEDLLRLGAKIDPAKIYYEPYFENRKEMGSPVLSTTYDPNSVFVRFDLQAIGEGYDKPEHCDWPRRLFGGVLFLADAEAEGIEGGEFGLFSDQDFKNDRIPHAPKLEKTFPVIGNTGVIFLNTNASFHRGLPVRRATGMRKWIYYSVSSRRDVWTAQPKTAQSVQQLTRGVEAALKSQDRPKALPEISREQLEYIVTGLYKSILQRSPNPVYLNKHCDVIEDIGFDKGIAYLVKHFASGEEFRKLYKPQQA